MTMVDIAYAAPLGSADGTTSRRAWSLPSRKVVKRALLRLTVVAGLAAAAYYGYGYWTVGQYLVSTDDAYVKADSTIIAPRVSGYIAQVLVQDNEPVKAGQVLARIDDRDFRTALNRARADIEAAEAAIGNIDAQIVLQRSVIDQNKADIAAAEAALTYARADEARYRRLRTTGYGTVQRAQQAESALREKTALRHRADASLLAAQNTVQVLTTARTKAEAELDHSRAVAAQAELDLSYTTIVAPVDGSVGARSLRVGQFVQAGTQLMAVVPLHAVYVVANFKETQLTHLRVGQPVEIAVDGFRGARVTGHVDSLSPASGLEFALLPPDNATGNFTKIVQRVPVKIALDNDTLSGLLRPGMSVEPTIDTKSTVVAEDGHRDDGRHRMASLADGRPSPGAE